MHTLLKIGEDSGKYPPELYMARCDHCGRARQCRNMPQRFYWCCGQIMRYVTMCCVPEGENNGL